ncbi:MAG: type II secretion system protein, partial [Planctomycetota bacterium]
MRNGPSPFSLFELLVSVGITVVLLAVLIPLLRTARMTAHRDQCRSNLKQLGDAWSAYLDDNGERFPFLAARPGWNYGGMRTARVTGTMSLDMRRPLNAYLTGSRSIFECPGDCGISHHEHRASGSTFEIFGTSYRLNANLVDARIAGVDEKGRGLHRSEL